MPTLLGYAYNNRNELTGSERKEGTVAAPAATVDAEGRLYEYDPIGNRIHSAEGTGPQVTYARNNVNQYTGLSANGSALSAPAYDDDGNMTGYDGAAYTWNAENRLTAVETPDKKITFLYDYMGRRVQKQVYGGTPGSWNASPDETRVFVYNGWNLIRETVSGAANGETYYVWGLDLSQGTQGAGGIGGLLCSVSGGEVRRYTYDANGNVGQLVDESGLIVARYEYDPFGNEIRADGAGAQNNPFRFSTKYLDAETGLYYYGFRYYSAELGRWLNRDPIEEKGGINLYAFVINQPIRFIDSLGNENSCPDKCNNPDLAPEYLKGTCDYYVFRFFNFLDRHPKCTPPDYYLQYGYKYCIAFNKLASKLSPKGYDWVKKTTKLLQQSIEDGLQDETIKMTELDNDKFKSFAFRTHADAYWNAGLYNVEFSDLIKIGLEPDIKEWIGDNAVDTWSQAIDIITRMIGEGMPNYSDTPLNPAVNPFIVPTPS